MARFRSKVVEIEAEPFDYGNLPLPFSGRGDPCCFDGRKWYVDTLEGQMQITVGDMVVRGLKGEFYPVKPDIFAMKYEEVG